MRVVDIGAGEMTYKDIFVSRGCEYVGCDIAGYPDVLIEEGKPVPLAESSFDGVVSRCLSMFETKRGKGKKRGQTHLKGKGDRHIYSLTTAPCN